MGVLGVERGRELFEVRNFVIEVVQGGESELRSGFRTLLRSGMGSGLVFMGGGFRIFDF